MDLHRPRGARPWARRTPFNMIEIILALGVIAVGVISILALFPIGLTASRDAMADSNGADVGDQMIHQLEYMVRLPSPGWTATLATIPAAPCTDTDFDIAPSQLVPNTQGTLYTTPTPVVPGKYKIIRYADADRDGNYTAGEVIDFEAIVRVWQSQVSVPGQTSAVNLDTSKAIRLNVELSWPAKLPYAQRQKSYYTKELFNRL